MNTIGPTPVFVPTDPLRQAGNYALDVMRSTMAPVTGWAEVDVTNLKGLHDRVKPEFEAATGVPLTYTPFFARAAVLALQANPIMNCSYTAQGYVYHPAVNLGIVTQVPGGILIPVILNAQNKNIPDLAREIAVNAERAKNRQVTPNEMATATFVITNPGRWGTTLFGTPTVMPPCVGNLGFETIQKRPVVLDDDRVVARPMMYISLTCDHRAVDGGDMSQFCRTVKQALERLDF